MDIVSKTDALRFVKPKFTNSARARVPRISFLRIFFKKSSVCAYIIFTKQNKKKTNPLVLVFLKYIYIYTMNCISFRQLYQLEKGRFLSFARAIGSLELKQTKKKHEMKARNIRGKQKKTCKHGEIKT